jgi:hypothetical protein
MADAEMELKREEDERLDTAEDPNEEVRHRAILHPSSCEQYKWAAAGAVRGMIRPRKCSESAARCFSRAEDG